LARLLQSLPVPYRVIDGQAVLRHGQPRMTRDIDLTVAVAPIDAQKVMDALGSEGLRPMVDNPQEFVLRTHVLPCQSSRSHLRLDPSFTDSPYELRAIERGVDVVVDGVAVRFASAEDLVIHKIIAGRPVDHQEVSGVLLKNPHIDAAYVRHWLAQFARALERPLVEDFERLWRDSPQ
jgi:hypothetical protein